MTTGEPPRLARRAAVKPTPLGLMVLALLAERPMHPYEMQRVMVERAKDSVINVQRGSLYPAVERMVKAGLVEPTHTGRDGRRPERTTYQLTPAGQDTVQEWLVNMLRNPKAEYPEFAAALAFLPHLSHADAIVAFEARHRKLAALLAAWDATAKTMPTDFPRLFLIESEFQRALLAAEFEWVGKLIAELRSGEFHWDAEKISAWVERVVAQGFDNRTD